MTENGALCLDCGGPVAVDPKAWDAGFACSGWHYRKGNRTRMFGIERPVICPKCGQKFEV